MKDDGAAYDPIISQTIGVPEFLNLGGLFGLSSGTKPENYRAADS